MFEINKTNIQDFIDFINDPEVKELEKKDQGDALFLSYNTGEEFLIKKDLAEKYGLTNNSTLDDLIFGKNKTNNIVNITVKDNKAWVYTETNGKIECQVKDYMPWILSSTPVGQKYKRLIGNQHYKYICHTEYQRYLDYTSKWQKKTWHPRTIEEGYQLLNGYSYFKGMKVDDVSLLSTDIETTGVDWNAEDAQVLLIANTFRKNGNIQRKLFDVTKYESDAEMISDWCKWVREINPSLIIGHNVLGFDLPYLNARSKYGLDIGRDRSLIRFDEKESKFRKDGSQKYGYYNARIHGREIIDTFFLSIKYDIGRKFPSYGLKPIIEHLGLEKENRIKWNFDQDKPKDIIKDLNKWKQFCEYAEDDADDSIKLFDIMVPSFFYLNQSIPKPFQQIINEATGSQLDSFFIRSYLQNGFSQPQTTLKEEFQGAISFGIPGNYTNVLSVDFHALYPSIIKQYELYDKNKDPKGYLLKATEYFTKVRVEYKNKFKETNDSMYDGMQLAAKVLANSLYGHTSANYLLYNSPDLGSFITKKGRELLDQLSKIATGKSVYTWKEQIEK